MIYIENKGQGSAEFILLISISLILTSSLVNFLATDNDLDLAVSAARNGIDTGQMVED